MPKLYYTPTSCGAASFIAAFAAGVSLEAEQVVFGAPHKTSRGDVDFTTINPLGNVPTLVLDDGSILNEGAATLQYIADLNPGTVAPAIGTRERYMVMNALNYVGTELHKGMHRTHSALYIYIHLPISDPVTLFSQELSTTSSSVKT